MGHRRQVLGTFAALAALGAGAGAWQLARGRVPATLRIGIGQPLSGPLAPLGQDLLRGAQMAVDDLNEAGGVHVQGQARPLALVVADDHADAQAGMAAARQLIAADPVAVIAHLNSGVSIATAPLYAAQGIPQLSISTKPEYTRLGLPTTLRLVANDEQQSRALAALAQQVPGARRLAVVDDGTPYGLGLAEGVAKLLAQQGRPAALRRSFDGQRTDFTDLVAAMAASTIDTLVTTLSDFQVLAFLEQAAHAGLRELAVAGGDTLKTDTLRQRASVARGLYVTSSIIEPKEFGQTGRTFARRYLARHGSEPVYGAHYAYDGVCCIADALSRCAGVDRAQLLHQLKTIDGNCPVTNSIRFDPDGEQHYAAVAAYHLRAGQWELLMRSDRW